MSESPSTKVSPVLSATAAAILSAAVTATAMSSSKDNPPKVAPIETSDAGFNPNLPRIVP